MAKEKVFAVFGLGSFGMELCIALTERGRKVIAFNNVPDQIDKIKETVTQALVVDSTDEDALKASPLEDVDVAVVAIGENVESNILTTAILKKMGIPYILARAVSETHARVLRQIGADEVVNPEIDEGRRIADRLTSQDVLDSVPLSKDYSIIEIYAPQTGWGQSTAVVNKEYAVRVVALRREESTIDQLGNPVRTETIVLAGDNETIRENDVLIAVGRNTDLERLEQGK